LLSEPGSAYTLQNSTRTKLSRQVASIVNTDLKKVTMISTCPITNHITFLFEKREKREEKKEKKR